KYHGPITTDHYGRQIPKHAHGTANLNRHTSSTKLIIEAVMDLYTRIVDKNLLVRRINITANHVLNETVVEKEKSYEQLDLFTDYEAQQKKKVEENTALLREKKMQLAILDIKKKYGKNAILKGTNFEEGAMTKERNKQIGGHKA
ncbi:MAG: DNA methylase, partial [Mobilitalea sp.]